MVLDETLPVWGFVGKLEKVEAASPAEKELHRCVAAARAASAWLLVGRQSKHAVLGSVLPSSHSLADARLCCSSCCWCCAVIPVLLLPENGRKRIWFCIAQQSSALRPDCLCGRISLFAHIHFDIAYNQDRVIEVNVSTDASRTVRHQLLCLPPSVPAWDALAPVHAAHGMAAPAALPFAQLSSLGCAENYAHAAPWPGHDVAASLGCVLPGGHLGGRDAQHRGRHHPRGFHLHGGVDADRHALRAAHGEVSPCPVSAAAPGGAPPSPGLPVLGLLARWSPC